MSVSCRRDTPNPRSVCASLSIYNKEVCTTSDCHLKHNFILIMVLSSAQRKTQFLLLFTYLCLWCTDNTSIYVKAENIDSLKLGDKLNATSKLCSKLGKYCMNFEKLTYFGNLAYLSISPRGNNWYVWIANRDQPVDMDSAVLSLNQSGALKIESNIGEPIILYDSPQPLNRSTIVATLLDTGNFVLEDIQKNIVLWQSFDHPTDSLLPGMKLGVNHKTGQNWSLVSWISNSKLLAASGPFRLDWEPIGRELVIKHREEVYWKSGKLIRPNKFEHIAEDKEVQYTLVSNESEDSFSFTLSNDEDFTTIWALMGNGQLINRNRKGDTLARADVCYGYNTDNGCQKYEDKPACRNFSDVFASKIGYPNMAMLNCTGNTSYTISDCQAMCWRNCSCFGFKKFHTNGTGCMFFLSSEGHNIAAGGEEFYLLRKNIQGIYVSKSFYQLESEKNIYTCY